MISSLARLRLRLTAWYVGTFSVILLLLGTALFLAISTQLSAELNRTLEIVTTGVLRAANARVELGLAAEPALVGAINEMGTPGVELYLFNADGHPVGNRPADPHVAAAALDALQDSIVGLEFSTRRPTRQWRGYGVRYQAGEERPYAVIALADATGVERQYQRLVETFFATALLALVPVGLGGVYLARVSAKPVEAAMEQLRRFTADAAHQLRTPVAVIRGRAEVTLEQERSPGVYAQAMHEIAREAAGLSRMVDDLLTLARADAGERPVRHEPLYLDDLAAEAVSSAAVLGQARAVRVTLGRYQETPVVGDPDLLRQLLMALLDNAVKFTPDGGTVQLDVYPDHGRPTVVVEDTGIGIASADLPRIFERFYRGHNARAGTPGAGLGLSVAQWIAQVHRARIEIASVPGRGTRVSVRFPRG